MPQDMRIAVQMGFLSGGVLLSVVLFYYFRKMALRVKYVDYDAARAAGPGSYRCPKCGQDMTGGFVVAGRGIVWRAGHEPAQFRNIFTMIHQSLANTIDLSFSIPVRENRAWHCAACQYLLIDHSALVGKGRPFRKG